MAQIISKTITTNRTIQNFCPYEYFYFHLQVQMLVSSLVYSIILLGRLGTTDDFTATPFHFYLFSTALVELAMSIPVRSLMLSYYLFFCLHLLFLIYCALKKLFFPRPEDLETCPNQLSFCVFFFCFCFFTKVKSPSYSALAAWIVSANRLIGYVVLVRNGQ